MIFSLNNKVNTSHILKITEDEFENQFNINFESLGVFFTNEKEMMIKFNNHIKSAYNNVSGENKKKYIIEISKLNLDKSNDLDKNSIYVISFITKSINNATIIRNLYLHPTNHTNNEFPPTINY